MVVDWMRKGKETGVLVTVEGVEGEEDSKKQGDEEKDEKDEFFGGKSVVFELVLVGVFEVEITPFGGSSKSPKREVDWLLLLILHAEVIVSLREADSTLKERGVETNSLLPREPGSSNKFPLDKSCVEISVSGG